MLNSVAIPVTRDLVLIGGGHTHALILKKWAMNPLPGVSVTLINPQAKAPYTGMLPGYIAGHYDRSDLDIDLVKLARRAGARLIIDYATGLDTADKRVHLANRPDISYDTVSVDIGITTHLPSIIGSDENAVSAKPLGTFADGWEAFIGRAKQTGLTPKIAVIGGGVAGVELALAMAHRTRTEGLEGAQVKLIEAEPDILRETGAAARRALLRELKSYGIDIFTGARVKEITSAGLKFETGQEDAAANFVITATGAQPYPWLSETGLALHDGYIEIDNRLRSVSAAPVFAAGDCAHMGFAPRPKAGVFAVRQAPVLFNNLRADLSGGNMKVYRPQKSYLKLISTGRKSAITDKWGLAPKGKYIWRVKDRIDQNFMKQFREVPAPSTLNLPKEIALGVRDMMKDNAPQCGGCGSKIAQAPLLEGLDGTAGGPLDDSAIIHRDHGIEIFTTDHLRAFTPDAWLMAKIAAVHALGDIWAMNGRAETVLAHIILPPMAQPQQAEMIRQILTGANSVFAACGINISGGHTSSGAELTIGFSVSGSVDKRPVTLKGAKPGDVIVLTKPIGVGVLLAGEMRQLADGDDYKNALRSMWRLQNAPANLLGPAANAMTDVTGFGLAGHLMNILDASGVSADLSFEDIPILPGAESLAERGIHSTLWPENAKLSARMAIEPSAKIDLLFDPQTCGGLLACIPESKIRKVLSDFKSAGEPIWTIGKILSGIPHINVINR